MRNIVLIYVLLFISASAFAQNPKKMYRNGIKLFNEQLYHDAIPYFDKAVKVDSTYIQAYVARAASYEKLDSLFLSACDYEKAAKLDKQTVGYYFDAGKNYYKVKKYDKALELLTKVVILDNKHFQGYQYKSFTHIKLGQYEKAIVAIDNALRIKETYLCHYARAMANDSLSNYSLAVIDYAKSIDMNPVFDKSYFAIIKAFIKNGDMPNAHKYADMAVKKFSAMPEVYSLRSQVFCDEHNYPMAINDFSKLETLVNDAAPVLLQRGKCYFKYGQYLNAKSDLSQVIALNKTFTEALYWRARSNEEIMENAEAIRDYKLFLRSKTDNNELVADAEKRLFELNREHDAPIIIINNPDVEGSNILAVKGSTSLFIEGNVNDENPVKYLKIEGSDVSLLEDNSFSTIVDIAQNGLLKFEAMDVYGNKIIKEYGISFVEREAPIVRILSPYSGDDNEIFLDSDDKSLFIEGEVSDASLIKEILVDSVRAVFNNSEKNPHFTAMVDILGSNEINISVTDVYGNTTNAVFTLNREGALISENNPMGKTWVIFIGNSNYSELLPLEGPQRDEATIKKALSNYDIHNFIYKKDMTKDEMERFFSIDLRNLVKANNINSLLIWYAGHGEYINNTGYWLPVDATLGDEFSYFNINSLKAFMQPYISRMSHLLVVSDACKSGNAFYLAMRSVPEARSCNKAEATQFRSAQVFTSATDKQATDNSAFTKAFSKTLEINTNYCLSIEQIVISVNKAMLNSRVQKPEFGTISGMDDEGGSFFFIRK